MNDALGDAHAGVTHCAVLGSPIAHSLSPTLHRAAYRHLGLIDWDYGLFEVDEVGLPGFLEGLDGSWRGLSLTMPLKQVALDCVDEVSAVVEQTSAINTILFTDGRRRGDNTDVYGMVEALRERGADRVPAAAVLGGGATARSALASLREFVGAVTVYTRTTGRATALQSTADALGLTLTVADWAKRREALEAPLVISTTPAGVTDDLAAAAPVEPGVLLDVVYAPWPTTLARVWSEAGGAVAGGADMLVHQALRQIELMTGRTVPLQVLRKAAGAALVDRGRLER